MKIAVSSTGKDLNSQIDPRFGRCACFVIVETEDMRFKAFDNENIALSGGVGIQSASFISSHGVVAVLTGNCGPNAMKALSAAGIKVFTGQTGTVMEAVERYKNSGLQPSITATVPEKSGIGGSEVNSDVQPQGTGRGMDGGGGRGMGGGGGRGMGGGGGRGMGGGGGRGMGGGGGRGGGADMQQGEGDAGTADASRQEELTALKKQAAELQKQIEKFETKINQ